MNVIKSEWKSGNRNYNIKRNDKKKDLSKFFDKFITQLTDQDLSIDIDDNTVEYEKNKNINIYNKFIIKWLSDLNPENFKNIEINQLSTFVNSFRSLFEKLL